MNGWYPLGALFPLPWETGNEYSEDDACQGKEDRLIGRAIDDERHQAQHHYNQRSVRGPGEEHETSSEMP